VSNHRIEMHTWISLVVSTLGAPHKLLGTGARLTVSRCLKLDRICSMVWCFTPVWDLMSLILSEADMCRIIQWESSDRAFPRGILNACWLMSMINYLSHAHTVTGSYTTKSLWGYLNMIHQHPLKQKSIYFACYFPCNRLNTWKVTWLWVQW
jgi:hypothetical protein